MTVTRRSLSQFLLLLFIAGSAWAQAAPARIADLKPTIILISIDGYRYDYPERYPSPNLQRLIRGGVRADAMIPIFPTKTFPNHYTIVTGMYGENHGIVSNYIYNPASNRRFTMYNRQEVQSSDWWGGEPIWVTLAKQGQRSAATFWPGSEAEIKGVRPAYWREHDYNFTPEQRIATTLEYLDLPRAERPTFLTIYFHHVDSAGHDYGPESPQVGTAIKVVDDAIGELLRGLEARGISEKVNVIVVSDHGMAQLSNRRIVFLEDIYDVEDVDLIESGPLFIARSKSGRNEELLSAIQRSKAPITAYRKEDAPARWHTKSHPLTAPIVGVMDEGWRISTRSRIGNRRKEELGTHGYDNSLRSMHAVFIGHGPAFRRGARVPAFENIHVYSLMAHILRVKPAMTDGSLAAVRHLLR